MQNSKGISFKGLIICINKLKKVKNKKKKGAKKWKKTTGSIKK